MQGSLAVLGHVGPMACSEKEASEGWLLSGPLLRGFLSGLMPQGPEYFLQSYKISVACLPEGPEWGKGGEDFVLTNIPRAYSCLVKCWGTQTVSEC